MFKSIQNASIQDACFQKGEAHYWQANYEKALIQYKAAQDFLIQAVGTQNSNLYVTLYEVSIKLAEIKYSGNDENENTAFLNDEKGRVVRNLGSSQQALPYYDEAIKLSPYEPHIHYNKGLALSDLGKNQDAIDAFYKAANLYGMGKDGIGQDAIACYDAIINIDPKHAYCNKGNILYAINNYPEALKCYDKVISIGVSQYKADLSNPSSIVQNMVKQLKYGYIDAYIGKTKISEASNPKLTTSTKFTKILSKLYENELYKDLQIVSKVDECLVRWDSIVC